MGSASYGRTDHGHILHVRKDLYKYTIPKKQDWNFPSGEMMGGNFGIFQDHQPYIPSIIKGFQPPTFARLFPVRTMGTKKKREIRSGTSESEP